MPLANVIDSEDRGEPDRSHVTTREWTERSQDHSPQGLGDEGHRLGFRLGDHPPDAGLNGVGERSGLCPFGAPGPFRGTGHDLHLSADLAQGQSGQQEPGLAGP